MLESILDRKSLRSSMLALLAGLGFGTASLVDLGDLSLSGSETGESGKRPESLLLSRRETLLLLLLLLAARLAEIWLSVDMVSLPLRSRLVLPVCKYLNISQSCGGWIRLMLPQPRGS